MTRRVLGTLGTLAALGALTGCVADTAGTDMQGVTLPPLPPLPETASVGHRSTLEVARLSVGDDELRFLQVGGAIAVLELSQTTSYVEQMKRQEATPLDLYLTLAGDGLDSAPPALWADHEARTGRAPEALELPLVDKSKVVNEPKNCGTFDLHGAARFTMPNGCHTDALPGFEVGHAVGRSTAMDTLADSAVFGNPDTYLYTTCASSGGLLNQVWVFDLVFGWRLLINEQVSSGRLFAFFYTGDFGRPVAFASVTTPEGSSTRYKLESLEYCD